MLQSCHQKAPDTTIRNLFNRKGQILVINRNTFKKIYMNKKEFITDHCPFHLLEWASPTYDKTIGTRLISYMARVWKSTERKIRHRRTSCRQWENIQ